jgi:hypothetical protein
MKVNKVFHSVVWNPTMATTASFLNINVHSTQPHTVDTLCIAPKHSINVLLVNAQLRECQSPAFDCARKTGHRAEPNIMRSNPNASTAGPTEEHKINQWMKGETKRMCRATILILRFHSFFSFDATVASWSMGGVGAFQAGRYIREVASGEEGEFPPVFLSGSLHINFDSMTDAQRYSKSQRP